MANCKKGKSCGSTCISPSKECRMAIPGDLMDMLNKFQGILDAEKEAKVEAQESAWKTRLRKEAEDFMIGAEIPQDPNAWRPGPDSESMEEMLDEGGIKQLSDRVITKEEIMDIFNNGRVLGNGSFGVAFANEDTVVKVGRVEESEAEMGAIGAQAGVGPKIYATSGNNVIVMERVRGISQNRYDRIREYLPDELNVKIQDSMYEQSKKLHTAGIMHGDLNTGNVVISRDGSVRFIDFAFAKQVDHPKPERRAKWEHVIREALYEPIMEYFSDPPPSPKVGSFLDRSELVKEHSKSLVRAGKSDVVSLYG